MDGFDERAIGEIADLLFQTVHDDGRWGDVMGAIKSALDLSSAAYGYVDAATTEQLMLHSDCDEPYAQTFIGAESKNPLEPAVLGGAVGAVHIDQMAMSRHEFERSTFFNEWLRPQGEHSVLTVALWRHGSAGAHLSMLRGGNMRPFDTSDITLLHQLMPVLHRVAWLRAEFGGQQLARRLADLDSNNDAFFVVDAEGRILVHNEAAERELRDPTSGLVAANRTLRVEGRVRERFRNAVHAATVGLEGQPAAPGDMLLEDPTTGRRKSALSVVRIVDAPALGLPVGRAAGVLVRRLGPRLPAGFEERLRGLFMLTAREGELAEALATGCSVQDFAGEQGISLSTARTHLSQLLQKTDTSRQGELIALLHSMAN